MSRRRLDVLSKDFFPAYVVWELTLRCDQACTHCGSRASAARPDELSTEEAKDVAGQLADLGTREVVLIGGEAYLHEGFLDVVRELARRRVRVGITTGGRGVTAELAERMKEAGIAQASVSVDGLEVAHDRMRNLKGSFRQTTLALRHLRAAGIRITANTNLNRSNRADLEALYEHLKAEGIGGWQIQITTPLGRAADRTSMILQPFDLLDLMPRIAALKERAVKDGIRVLPGNNLGYFGPEEVLLRSADPTTQKDHWAGCQAGRFVMGIESDGAVKGCPSLQTASYVGGKTRDRSVASIWRDTPELAFARTRTVDDLWGYCRSCAFASVCLGGCSFTAHSLFGRPGNNPLCHFRAREHAKQGKRERLVPRDPAPGLPFDCGTFDVVVEDLDAPDPDADVPVSDLVQITRKPTASGGARSSPVRVPGGTHA